MTHGLSHTGGLHPDARSLEDLVDRCVGDLVSGRATLDECLARHPEHREQLDPLLRAAVALNELPMPEVRPSPERRAAFMAEIRQTPQQHARRGWPQVSLPRLTGLGALAGSSLWRGALVGVPAAALALVAVLFVTATNPSAASAATLTVFAGTVEQQVGDRWRAIEDGAALDEGATLRTGSGSRALVTFADGSTATVDASTQLTLRRVDVSRETPGARTIEIVQASGRLWNDVVPVGGDDSYVIQTPHATVSAQGTVFETEVEGMTAVRADAGLVRLTARGQSVDVLAGQRARASAEQIEAPEEAFVAGAISVDAPAVAYLTSEDGAATGVSADGAVFRQVPGITTSGFEAAEVQRFTVGDAMPGRYALVVQRVGEGDGNVVLETPAGRIVLPIPEGSNVSRVEVEVEVRDGVKTFRAVDTEVREVAREDAPEVRVAEVARTRRGLDLEALLAARAANRAEQAAAVTPTETPGGDGGGDNQDRDGRGDPARDSGARESGARESGARDNGDDGSREDRNRNDSGRDDRGVDRDRDGRDNGRDRDEGRPGGGRGDAPRPTPRATPQAEPTVAAATTDDDGGAWRRQLQEALRRGSDRSLAAVLQETLTGDPEVDRARLEALIEATGDRRERNRVTRLLASERYEELGAAIREALERLLPDGDDRLRDSLPRTPAPSSRGDARDAERSESGRDRDERDRDEREREPRRWGGLSSIPWFFRDADPEPTPTATPAATSTSEATSEAPVEATP